MIFQLHCSRPFYFGFYSLIFLLTSGFTSTDIDQELYLFNLNASKYMDAPRIKFDENNLPVPLEESLFPPKVIRDKKFIEYKNIFSPEKQKREEAGTSQAPIGDDENPRAFVDKWKYSSIQEMDSAQLLSVSTPHLPWSDTYWPIAKGILGQRYADPQFPNTEDWKANSDYALKNLGSGSTSILSPSEKYDLLIGDSSHTLTKHMFSEGEAYFNQSGVVESWMGICHGWAPASFEVSRPTKKIVVLAADGKTEIVFYPTDIKALASLLWANGTYNNRFMGRRCNIKSPKKDENGRVIDPECFDSNPGAWHLAIVNQLGHSQRPLIMDATYDYQVWNQPVYAYKYTYFNPVTQKAVQSLNEAKVSLGEFTNDKFKLYRGKLSTHVVGIAMQVTYAQESEASTEEVDGPEFDRTRSVRYLYDLELNESGEILGGEWYTNLHPDFIWGPSADAKIKTVGDTQIDLINPSEQWSAGKPIPNLWRSAAQRGARQGQPLARIVAALVEWSRSD